MKERKGKKQQETHGRWKMVGAVHRLCLCNQKKTELRLSNSHLPPPVKPERVSKQRSATSLQQKVLCFRKISVCSDFFVTVFLQDQVTAFTIKPTIKEWKNCPRKIILSTDMKKRICLNVPSSHVKNKKEKKNPRSWN